MMLLDQAAIVTGGACGMGRAIALKFASQGCDVAVVDISTKAAEETVQEVIKMGREAIAIECDVMNADAVHKMVGQVVEKFKKVDILVNTAGGVAKIENMATYGVLDISEDEWDRILGINLKGAFLCSKKVIPLMKERKKGNIINFTSVGAVHPMGPTPHYHAAKAGLIGMTYDNARELGRYNIRVNAIMPGPIFTKFFDNILENKTKEEREAFFAGISKSVPLQRMGLPEDIANAALFLASDMASFVTASVLRVTGGAPMEVHVD